MKEKSLLVIEDSQGRIYENGLMKSGCEGINSYLLIYNFSWYCIDELTWVGYSISYINLCVVTFSKWLYFKPRSIRLWFCY